MGRLTRADNLELDRLRAAIAASADAVYDWDLRTGRIVWSGNARHIFGLDDLSPVAVAEGYFTRITPSDLAVLRRVRAEHLESGDRFECEYRFSRGDGELCWLHDRGLCEYSEAGEPVRVIGTVRCVTPQKRNEARLSRLTNFDELTGHYNRSRLREALEHSVAHSVRHSLPGAYMVIGIDNLPLIHDTYGQEVAERVVVAASRELDRSLRASDVIGRVDTDRFGVILNGCPDSDAPATADKILQAVQQATVVAADGKLPVTASIGAVAFPETVRSAHEATAKASLALENARRSGQNCFAVYDLTAEQRSALRQGMATGELVQTALKTGRVGLVYQPVVDSATGEPVFYECLLRLVGDDGQLVPAGSFLPVAERMGLVRSIDRHVLEIVVAELVANPEVKLALNISGLSTTDPSWLRTLIALVKSNPDIADRLLVEITETTALHDLVEATRFVAALRDMGCHVALDDFGAGYTSFRHLQELAVDMVKIDGSFIRTITHGENSLMFVRTLQTLAAGLNLTTVAEFVESAEAADILVEEGVNYLQGYHFGRPAPERGWLSPQQHVGARPAAGDVPASAAGTPV